MSHIRVQLLNDDLPNTIVILESVAFIRDDPNGARIYFSHGVGKDRIQTQAMLVKQTLGELQVLIDDAERQERRG